MGDEVKNGGTERSTLPLSRSTGASKKKRIKQFPKKSYGKCVPSAGPCGINM